MKRIISLALVIILCLGLLAVDASAASASGYFSGPSDVKAGDIITLTFGVSGSGIIGVDGTISYDSSMLTLVSTSKKIGSSWLVEFNGNKFVAYDNTQENPINGSAGIFTAEFQVKESLAPGTRITASVTGVTASDGNADLSIGTVTYSTALVQPKEQSLDLQSLSVGNGKLSPAFQPSVTEYTVTIPAGDSKVNLTAVPVDSNVDVAISSTSVNAGSTKRITVTVTGENGATKVYTISATRPKGIVEPRPTEATTPTQPSTTVPEETEPVEETQAVTEPTAEPTQPQTEATDGEVNTDLKSLEVIGGILQPAFQSGIMNYSVEVSEPIEIGYIIAETADPEAGVQVTTQAAAGDGTQHFAVTVIGKDGSTKIYNITALQAAKAEVQSPHKCGFDCLCVWLWLVNMLLLVVVVIVMFLLYRKLREKK